jgi:hypothetical protein
LVDTPSAIAASLFISEQALRKYSWLSRRYGPEMREKLGTDVLETLGTSHLEVVASLAEPQRLRLLRRAASDSLSVRELRALAPQSQGEDEPEIYGGSDLNRAAKALKAYAEWPDAALSKLLAGPRGRAVRTLAEHGERLSMRLRRADLPSTQARTTQPWRNNGNRNQDEK